MGLVGWVVDAYDRARGRGESRAGAFLHALNVYRACRPELMADEAGREVVRILLGAAAVHEPGLGVRPGPASGAA